MSSTQELFNDVNISADTGVFDLWPDQGVGGFYLTDLRLRIKCNTIQFPYLGGQMLVTISWNDGIGQQDWNVSLNTDDVTNYSETGIQIWQYLNEAITCRIQPTVPGGSIDVIVLSRLG